MDTAHRVPWGALRYACGVGVVLALATALGGPKAGIAAASGAVNAGAVGLTSGLEHPRAAMTVSALALALAAFLGSVTAPVPALAVVVLAGLAIVAGLAAGAGKTGSTVGVQALVGFVTLGHIPLPLTATALLCLLVLGGAAAQIVLGTLLRADVLRAVARRMRRARGPTGVDLPGRTTFSGLLRDLGRAVVRPEAGVRWHAARLALCLVAAELIGFRLSGMRGYWIALTALNVLKPDWLATASRGVERWLGTLVGVTVGGLFAATVRPTGILLVVAVVVVIWATFAVEPINYGLYCAGIAAYVVVFLQVIRIEPISAALDRVIDTTLGGALALLAYFLLRRRRSRGDPRDAR